MKAWTLPLTGLAAAALGASIAVAVMALWEPWEESVNPNTPAVDVTESTSTQTPSLLTPTPYVPRLTGAEAAARAKGKLNTDATENPITLEGTTLLRQFEDCEAVDFNENSLNWVVTCMESFLNTETDVATDPETSTWLVSDETGDITRP